MEKSEWTQRRTKQFHCAASPSTLSSFRSPAARGEKEDKSWMERLSFLLFFILFHVVGSSSSRRRLVGRAPQRNKRKQPITSLLRRGPTQRCEENELKK